MKIATVNKLPPRKGGQRGSKFDPYCKAAANGKIVLLPLQYNYGHYSNLSHMVTKRGLKVTMRNGRLYIFKPKASRRSSK